MSYDHLKLTSYDSPLAELLGYTSLGDVNDPFRVLVYRIEHETKKWGPYFVDSPVLPHFYYKHDGCPNHPGPHRSWGYTPYGSEIFGFVSMEGLLTWFDEEDFEVLIENGEFRLKIYNAIPTLVCKRTEQCVFQKAIAVEQASYKLQKIWHYL